MSMDLHLRALTVEERAVAFKSTGGTYDPLPYVRAVQQMRSTVAYAITLNGATARSTRMRFSKAAKSLGRRLRWAKQPKDATEVVVEVVGELGKNTP